MSECATESPTESSTETTADCKCDLENCVPMEHAHQNVYYVPWDEVYGYYGTDNRNSRVNTYNNCGCKTRGAGAPMEGDCGMNPWYTSMQPVYYNGDRYSIGFENCKCCSKEHCTLDVT